MTRQARPLAPRLQLDARLSERPILVDGRGLGHVSSQRTRRVIRCGRGAEARLAAFTELVATAIANAESRDALARLADEQAALRRVATLVARDAPPGEVFDAVAMEVGTLLDTDITVVGRYDGDGAATAIGSWSASPGGVPVGTRSVVGGHNVLTLVAETERPARVDGYDDASGEAAEIARRHGWRSSIAAPIIVEGRVWGVMLVATQRPEPFPAGAEERLAAFTDLVATALANAQAHDEVRRFGEEQAALGRVATLVAAGAAPEQVFTAVVEEVSSLLGLERIELVRYDGDDRGTVIAASGDHPVPRRNHVVARRPERDGDGRPDDDAPPAWTTTPTLTGEIAQAARGAGFRSAIGAPITVEGRLWGVIIAISTDPEPIPERSEARLGQFTELVATAVANAEAREALARSPTSRLRCGALRRWSREGCSPRRSSRRSARRSVACSARRSPPSAGSSPTRRRSSHSVVGTGNEGIPIGSRWELDDRLASAQVFRTGRSVRVDEVDWSAVQGALARVGNRLGIASTVASPIFVEGRLWGVVSVSDDEATAPGGRRTAGEVQRADRNRNRQRGRLGGARRVAAKDRGRRRRGAPPDRARSA